MGFVCLLFYFVAAFACGLIQVGVPSHSIGCKLTNRPVVINDDCCFKCVVWKLEKVLPTRGDSLSCVRVAVCLANYWAF